MKKDNILYTGGGVYVYFETLNNGVTFMIESSNFDYCIVKNIHSEEKFLKVLNEDIDQLNPFYPFNQILEMDNDTKKYIELRINEFKKNIY